MEFKTNVSVNIKTSIRCPKCREKFEKTTGSESSVRCPHCGTQLRISSRSVDEALGEAEAKVAGTLGKMGLPLPQNFAEIAKARALAKPMNIIGVIATIWAILFPFPYKIAVLACTLIPLASMGLMGGLRGKISFETKKRRTEEPYLTFALAGPPLALAWRALNDFHILAFDNVWVPAAAVSLIFSAVIFFFSADVKRKPAYILVTLIFGFAYGYGIVAEANCLLDNSTPKTYTASVLGKRTSYTSKSHSYYIKITPWGPRAGENEISIKRSGFDRIKVNDRLSINVREGMLHVPWFTIQPAPRNRM